jgi:tetratricopeptide (TPR) repeat protein
MKRQKPRLKPPKVEARLKPPKAEARPSRPKGGRSVYAAATLALITLLAYSNSFSAGFVYDNAFLLLQDPRLRELSGENIRLIFQHTYWWPTSESGLYRPFTTLSYLFNYAVLGNAHQPAGYHVINFLLHLGNVFLVYALMRRFLREFWPAFFAAALWAVHPVLTESLTNIIGRSDLLSALAVLSGFLMYLKSTESAGARRFAWLAGLAAVTAVGVFSKESAVVIVGVIALYEITCWKERKARAAEEREMRAPLRYQLLGLGAALLPIAVMLYQRSSVLAAVHTPEVPFLDNPIVGASFWRGRLTALAVIPRYLGLTLWPARLSADYSYAQIPVAHGSWQDWTAWLAVVAAALLVVAWYRWNRTAFFLAGFAAIAFLPTSNLLFPIGTIMAERFLYVPAIGLVACLVMAIDAAGRKIPTRHFAPIVLCVLTAACAVRTWIRNGDWQDDRTLAESIVRACPNSFRGHTQLAITLVPTDEPGPDLDRAIAEIERSVAILDRVPDSHNTAKVFRLAGDFYLTKGDAELARDASQSSEAYQRALRFLQRAIAIDRSVRAELDREGGAEWARRHAQATASDTGDRDAYWMLVEVYLRLGNTAAAAAAADQALALHLMSPEGYRQVSYAYAAQNRPDDAAVALIAGGLITSDSRLSSDILDFYQKVYSGSCAIKAGPQGPELNPACEMVHQHFCTAFVEVVKSVWAFKGLDAAEQQEQNIVNNYGCPAGPLEKALPPYPAKTP